MNTQRQLFALNLCWAFAACATGVDVSDEELAALLAESTNGRSGASGLSGSGGSAAAPSGLGGSAGNSVPSGLGGSGGTSAPPTGGAGAGGAPVPVNPGGGCGTPAPVASGGCATDTAIAVIYTDRSDAPSFNQLSLVLSAENAGADFPLTDLVLRYWFAAEGGTDFVAEVDYAQIGKENVCVSFGNQLGQSFADIGFTSSAALGEGVSDIQLRLHTPNYAQQDQANDFSFVAASDGLPNENITVYRAGTRVSGCEPQ